MKVLAISGSLRKQSTNTQLIHVAQHLMPSTSQMIIYHDLGKLPHFNPDLDSHLPQVIREFRQRMADADAVLISTPEYAHGIPGVLKNALDWLVSDERFEGKRIGILFASATDGSFAQQALLEVLRTMSAKIIQEAILNIAGSRGQFTPEGDLRDGILKERLRKVLAALTS